MLYNIDDFFFQPTCWGNSVNWKWEGKKKSVTENTQESQAEAGENTAKVGSFTLHINRSSRLVKKIDMIGKTVKKVEWKVLLEIWKFGIFTIFFIFF